MLPEEEIRSLYRTFGQRKSMGEAAENIRLPHFFLHRPFLGDQDLLIIFNTKRCRYQCHFCQLPAKSSKRFISGDDILAQFMYVVREMKHSLSLLTRVTLSNEGSILDAKTFPTDVLLTIASCIKELSLVRRFVLETRLEFIDPIVIRKVKAACPRVVVDILTGFETKNPFIRDKVLFKEEPLECFLESLDKVSLSGCDLTAYVLFKPSYRMSDEEAMSEAEESIDFLVYQCHLRNVPLSIRLNPMYVARGSQWAQQAAENGGYLPPKLTDVMRLASKKREEGIKIYIGLSTEGLDEDNYISRPDFSSALIRPIKLFNDNKIQSFGPEVFSVKK